VPCQSLDAYKASWTDWADRIQCIPTFNGKFKAIYSGGSSYSVDCDGNTILSSNQTNPSGYQHSAMTEAIIGECVTDIGNGAFWSCHSLSSITLPDSIVSIGRNAFYDCPMLTGITIPSGVTTIGEVAFAFCYRLANNLNIPDSVTSIGDNAFESCRSLTSITIGSGLTTINHSAFYDCRSLTTITIPSGVTSIGSNAFDSCSGLTSITVEATTPPTLGSYAFYRTNDCPIYVPSESVNAYKTASVWSTYSSRIQAIQ